MAKNKTKPAPEETDLELQETTDAETDAEVIAELDHDLEDELKHMNDEPTEANADSDVRKPLLKGRDRDKPAEGSNQAVVDIGEKKD